MFFFFEYFFPVKELKTSVKYTIRVWAFSILGVGSVSSAIEYKISSNQFFFSFLFHQNLVFFVAVFSFGTDNSGNMKGSRAITAGVVGSVLFFVAAIILSVCAVKICNKRKQRKMEKG